MKKFRFKFETLERVRKGKENESLRALAKAQLLHQDCLNAKQKLLTALSESLGRREQLGSQPIGMVAFQLESEYISGTKHRIGHADQAIFRAKKGVEKALRAYLMARRQTRAIEILREKAFSEYKKERMKYEQKQLDDLYVMRARLNQEGP